MKAIISVLAMVALSQLGKIARAADPPRWLDDQTVAVMRFSVEESVDSSGLLRMIAEAAPPVANEMRVWEEELKSISAAVRASGSKEIIVVMSMADAFSDQPLLVMPGAKALDLNLIKSTFLGNGILNPFRRAPSLTSGAVDGDLIIAPRAIVERVSNGQRAASEVVAAIGRAPAANSLLTITGSLNRDQRRALTEMLNTSAADQGSGLVGTLVRDLEAIEIDIASSHELLIRLVGKPDEIESKLKAKQTQFATNDAAEHTIQDMLMKFMLNEMVQHKPERGENSLTWKLSLASAMQAGLGKSLGKVVLESDRMTAMQRLMRLGLAMHNHHSTHNKFPSVSTANGKPRMLSWRVDLLPFLDENQLYREFHLDEPWDSEHNKKLVARMPDVFRCPQSKHTASSGLSTFVLPVHDKSMWVNGKDIDFKDIEDGTSNTIMIADARDESAQVWTRPEPFEVDLTAPQKQLGGHFDGILSGFGDGSARFVPSKFFDQLPALITRSGGEVTQF